MYSYNNIVEKAEPAHKAVIDHALDAYNEQQQQQHVHELDNGDDHVIVATTTTAAAAAATPTVRAVAADVDCLVVDDFLTAAECDALVTACEQVGYTFWHTTTTTTTSHTDKDDNNGSSNSNSNSSNEDDVGVKHGVTSPLAHKVDDDDDSSHNNSVAASTACDRVDAVCAVRVVDTIEADFDCLSRALYARLRRVVPLPAKTFTPDMPDASIAYARELHGTWLPCALSRNLLLGRYRAGGHFMPHMDGATVVDLNTRSFYTLLVYLNDCPDGGATRILRGEQAQVTVLDAASQTYRGRHTSVVASVQPCRGRAVLFHCDVLHEAMPVTGNDSVKYICRADVLYRRTPPILTSDADARAFALYQQARRTESGGDATRACAMFRGVRRLSPGVAALYQLD